MKFSRRELYILVVTLVIGVGWLGNGYVLQPYLAERKDLALKNKEADRVLRRANATIAQRKDSARMWKDMLGNGLQADVSTAQSQMVHSVGDWAQSAGLNISSVSPERADQDKQFRKINLRATASGSMSAVANFLWKVRTSSIPARVTDIVLSARPEGSDNLTVTVGISTLVLADAKDEKAAAPISAERETR